MKNFLFVCGCPRSGTSYLTMLLSAHPDIALGMERFNRRLVTEKLVPADFEAERFFDVRPGDTWYTDLARFEAYYAGVRAKYATAKYVGDKTPRAYERYGYLSSKFVNLSCVFAVRNVYDVAASYESRRQKGVNWPDAWGARKAVEHWNDAIRRTLAAAEQLPVLPVAYEALVTSGDGLDRIAAFLDIDPAPLRASWQRLRRKETREPGAGIQRLPPADAAFVKENAEWGLLEQVTGLAKSPPPYAGAWRTLREPKGTISKYFEEDAKAVRYPRSRPPASRVMLRNPEDAYEGEGRYIAFLGSAATFGRLVRTPFVEILRDRLRVRVVNLGVGGARPVTFRADPGLQRLVRDAACVVVEAMSARGYATEVFVPAHDITNAGKPLLANFPPREGGQGHGDRFVNHAYNRAWRQLGDDMLQRARMVCRAAYVRDMKLLAQATRGRNVLLYFSKREPAFTPTREDFDAWTGGFPHHVDSEVLDALVPWFSALVTVVSKDGSPEPIVDSETGKPLPLFPGQPDPTVNSYYPSSGMHRAAADALEPVLRRMLAI